MVLVTNLGTHVFRTRLPTGNWISIGAGQTAEITSKRTIAMLEKYNRKNLRITKSNLLPPKTGRRLERQVEPEGKPSGSSVATPEESARSTSGTTSEELEKSGFKGLKRKSRDRKLGKLPKQYYKLGLSKGWKKFKEDRAFQEDGGD